MSCKTFGCTDPIDLEDACKMCLRAENERLRELEDLNNTAIRCVEVKEQVIKEKDAEIERLEGIIEHEAACQNSLHVEIRGLRSRLERAIEPGSEEARLVCAMLEWSQRESKYRDGGTDPDVDSILAKLRGEG